jgi:imidazolonepropionase-like amidohydrolase
MQYRLLCCLGSALWLAASLSHAEESVAELARPQTAGALLQAIVGARIVASPEETIDNATLVIRQDGIIALGEGLPPPAGAQVWDLSGKTIYAGFIDALAELPMPLADDVALGEESVARVRPIVAHHNPRVAPQRRAERWYQPVADEHRCLRNQGFVARLVAPTGAVIHGESCLVSTASPGRPWLLESRAALHVQLKPPRRGYHVGYPTSPMGAMALVRQSFLDAQWYAAARSSEEIDWLLPPPRVQPALEVLARYLESQKLVIIDAVDELYLQRADRLAREFSLNAAVCGSGEEYQRLKAVRQTGRTVIVPLDFPGEPHVETPEAALDVSLARLLHWDLAPENPARLAQAGVPMCFTTRGLTEVADFLDALRLAVFRGLDAKDALRALTITPAQLLGVGDRLGTLTVGKRASFVVADGDLFTANGRIVAIWVDGHRYETVEDEDTEATQGPTRQRTAASLHPKALFDVNYPLGSWGRDDEAAPPTETVLFRNATIWTCGPQGIIEGGSVLIGDGRVVAVGRDITAPDDARVIDATGKHLTPGLIDCHSHIATDGGLTEAGRTSTGEVRIADYLDDEDIEIYRQLASGVTCVNVLPGSDNTICGQSQVIKLRWGERSEALAMAEAPPGMKFALGENAKQSNWGDDFTSRYPQTRMGVEQLLLDAFRAAAAYRRQWENWQREPRGPAPRVDLELEALAEVLAGQRRIHCHAYRQDEMLMLLRTCSALNIPMGTFHHALEGYKVADVLAAQRAGASVFSDWWAFKFEALDGIPFNPAMLKRAGVLVSINSDDAELARRLHLEAAKAMKYGGLPASDALTMVTINPARQLGIDQVVGSLEAGKHADLAVWSSSPLSTLAICEQTWVDGRRYFDRQQDLRKRQEAERKKAALVQRVLEKRHRLRAPVSAELSLD